MAEPSLATTRGVDLGVASKIIDTALGLARSRKLRPMTIAVLDSGGDLVAFKREDGTGIRRYDIVIDTEPELLRAMFDVGYFPPNTPPRGCEPFYDISP